MDNSGSPTGGVIMNMTCRRLLLFIRRTGLHRKKLQQQLVRVAGPEYRAKEGGGLGAVPQRGAGGRASAEGLGAKPLRSIHTYIHTI